MFSKGLVFSKLQDARNWKVKLWITACNSLTFHYGANNFGTPLISPTSQSSEPRIQIWSGSFGQTHQGTYSALCSWRLVISFQSTAISLQGQGIQCLYRQTLIRQRIAPWASPEILRTPCRRHWACQHFQTNTDNAWQTSRNSYISNFTVI